MENHRRFRLGLWLAASLVLLALSAAPVDAAKAVMKAPSGKNRDLVVLEYERWIDTLKGIVKNFSRASARDVTVVVRFLDGKRKMLGTQRVSVGDLQSGDQNSWSLPIQDKHRTAKFYQFTVHAIWQ